MFPHWVGRHDRPHMLTRCALMLMVTARVSLAAEAPETECRPEAGPQFFAEVARVEVSAQARRSVTGTQTLGDVEVDFPREATAVALEVRSSATKRVLWSLPCRDGETVRCLVRSRALQPDRLELIRSGPTLILAGRDANRLDVLAVDAHTGQQRWHQRTELEWSSSLDFFAQGALVIVASLGHLRVLRADTGAEVFGNDVVTQPASSTLAVPQQQPGGPPWFAWALDAGGPADFKVQLYDVNARRERGHLSWGGEVRALALWGTTLFISGEHSLAAFDVRSSKRLWQREWHSREPIGAPVVSEGRVWVALSNDTNDSWMVAHEVAALDLKTGADLWCRTFDAILALDATPRQLAVSTWQHELAFAPSRIRPGETVVTVEGQAQLHATVESLQGLRLQVGPTTVALDAQGRFSTTLSTTQAFDIRWLDAPRGKKGEWHHVMPQPLWVDPAPGQKRVQVTLPISLVVPD